MVTPALNILGMPMPYAIGSDILHMAGKAGFSTYQHAKLKNIDYKLGLVMLLGTVTGIECGAQVVMHLEKIMIIEEAVRYSYLVLLLAIGLVILYDIIKLNRGSREGISWHKKLRKIPLRPYIHFKKADITCSLWLPVLIGYTTGFLAGFLGIGGGLFRFPALVYLLGCPVPIAIGTDIFEVLISGIYGGVSYSMKNRVDFVAVAIMLLGAAFGAKIGAIATKYVDPTKIKLWFSFAVFGSLFSILLKQLSFVLLSEILIFLVIGTLTSYIVISLIVKCGRYSESPKKT